MASWDASRRRIAAIAAATAAMVAAVSLGAWFGSAQQAVPRWSVGDFWTYTTSGVDFHETYTERVMGQTNLSTPNGPVQVWRLEATYTQLAADGSPVGQPFIDEYYLTQDLAIARIDRSVPPYRMIYSPPNGSWPFPLDAGSRWDGSVQATYWWTPDGSNQQTASSSFAFHAAGDGIVSVPAGTFRAIGVVGDFLGLWRSGYIAQYSDTVGYIVRSDLLDGQGNTVGYYQLTAYRYQAGTPTRALVLVVVLGVDAGTVGVAWLLVRVRRGKSRESRSPGPEPPGGESKQ